MKKFITIAALLSVLLCTRCKDTARANVWERTIEPRISHEVKWTECVRRLPADHVVETTACSIAPVQTRCDEVIGNREQALHALAFAPPCTDAALAFLAGAAATDHAAANDLAAAYYVRAQRFDRASDLLRSLNASEDAGQEPAALFNRALAQEAIGLSHAAERSWRELIAADSSDWSIEARRHLERLVQKNRSDATSEWRRNHAALPQALHARDRAAIARLIAPFPSTAERYLEEELLPQWAEGKADLDSARLLAEELRTLNQDRYASDIVESLAHSPPSAEARNGVIAYGAARRAEQAFELGTAASAYDAAVRSLSASGNPLVLLARLGSALAVSLQDKPNANASAIALLQPIQQEALRAGYRYPLARVQAMRAHFLFEQSRYLESLTEYDNALATYEALHDVEGMTAVHVRKISVFRSAGQKELAWREALQAIRNESRVPEFRSHHVLLGEVALTALALEFPRTALLFQNEAIDLIATERRAAQGVNPSYAHALDQNLAIALRGRAQIEANMKAPEAAARDLDQVIHLLEHKDVTDPRALQILRARIAEVRGESLLPLNATASAAAFTGALNLAADDEFRTFRASLYAQRAEAERRANDDNGSERDLMLAISELREEEQRVLQNRPRGLGEELWSAYFSRFQETYRLLIRLKVEKNRQRDAFAYAEKSRALEPLDLVLRLNVVPQRLRELASADANVDDMRAALPEGTYVIEYCVLEGGTYAWILSRDAFVPLSLRARNADVERWSATLQLAAHQRNAPDFEGGLYAPYAELIARPLEEIEKLSIRHPLKQLVLVPDGAMHSLPFAALRDPVTRRYLIQRAPISISPSMMLYLFSLFRDGQLPHEAKPAVLLIGDPSFNARLPVARDLDRLPFARTEVERLHNVYPDSKVLADSQATVPAFLQLAQDQAIVHIAAHTIINADMPSRSMLLLAPSQGDTGALDAQQLLTRLKLDKKTRLVVLSTCSSAGGLPLGPEGVAPLVRPLITAGVPAVIGSLWDVQDATAEEVMVSFHRHYRTSSDVATALRAAQVELLGNKNPGLRSVLAWAPFQVIGYASSPDEPAQHP